MPPLQKLKSIYYGITFSLLLLVCNTDNVTDGGTETGNPVITGKLCQTDGEPAEGVEVKIYNVNYLPSGVNIDTTYYTDSKGEYVIPLPDSGAYNIIGQASDKSVFIDSVKVEDTVDVEVPTDTIRLSGGIIGISHLVGQNDTNQIRVTLFIPGTNYLTKPNIGGAFSFSNVPEGTYALFFDPTDPAYFVKIIEVTVTAGEVTDLDTIILYSDNINGIPIVNLGNDTTLSINDTIRVNGTASDPYGSIISMEWSIGGSNFIPASSPDTIIVAPSVEDLNYSCILKVVDNDQNVAYDTLIAQVKTDPPVAVITAPDTTMISSNVTLSSSSSTPGDFGSIVKYEWSIDSYNDFKETSGNDTTILTDSTEIDSFIIALRITDDDGNTDCDTSYIVITKMWELVGIKGFSDGGAGHVSLAIDNNNTPFVAFVDAVNGSGVTVMKYNGTSWEPVGNKGFSDDGAWNTSIAIDNNNVPFVAYRDAVNGQGATVMTYNGSLWGPVGNKGFSGGQADSVVLAIDGNNVLYVGYKDWTNEAKSTVMKYNGNLWEPVGNAGFSDSAIDCISLDFGSNNTPYSAFIDFSAEGSATLMKFNDPIWELVGDQGFTYYAGYTSLALDNNNTPFVAFRDGNAGDGISVMKYNGSAWEQVGNAGFSDDRAERISIAIDNNNTPFVAFRDEANYGGATVMKYNGTVWKVVGNKAIVNNVNFLSLSISKNGVLYIAFCDIATGRKCTVMRYR